VMASLCCYSGRADDAVRYGEAGLALLDDPRYDRPPFGYAHNWVGLAYLYTGRPDRMVELCRSELESSGDPLALARACVVLGLAFLGLTDEATAMAGDLVAAAEATGNPGSLSFALEAYGAAFRRTYPVRALTALHRGMGVALESGGRFFEALIGTILAGLESEHGDPRVALDLFAQAINLFHDSGDTLTLRTTFGIIAVSFDRTGRHEAAARLYGASDSSLAVVAVPELPAVADHLRYALGEAVFERLAREGAAMERADAVRYAHAQIQLAREELAAPA